MEQGRIQKIQLRYILFNIPVVLGCGLTAVKIFMRLWLQKFVSPVNPQPFVRVVYRDFQKKMTTKDTEHKFKK
jgi:hypothetical protein